LNSEAWVSGTRWKPLFCGCYNPAGAGYAGDISFFSGGRPSQPRPKPWQAAERLATTPAGGDSEAVYEPRGSASGKEKR